MSRKSGRRAGTGPRLPRRCEDVPTAAPGGTCWSPGCPAGAGTSPNPKVTLLVTAVSNTGQTEVTTYDLLVGGNNSVSLALAFTTGASAVTLSEVAASLAAVDGNAGVKVSIWSNASGLPDSKLYDLNNPGAITVSALNTFTAPANATLDALTTYAVVFENTVSGGANKYNLEATETPARTRAP